MKLLTEYLSNKIVQSTIKATDNTIHKIVIDELDRLGHDADLNHIDTSEVHYVINLFRSDATGIGSRYADINPDVSKWNMSNVKEAMCMFMDCKNFNCDLSNWDMSMAENIGGMFCNCTSFNQNLNNWNTSNLQAISQLFFGCTSFNMPLNRWDVSKISWARQTFRNCKSFNQDISNWILSNKTCVDEMFKDCEIQEDFKPKFKNGKTVA